MFDQDMYWLVTQFVVVVVVVVGIKAQSSLLVADKRAEDIYRELATLMFDISDTLVTRYNPSYD